MYSLYGTVLILLCMYIFVFYLLDCECYLESLFYGYKMKTPKITIECSTSTFTDSLPE